jgi:hypothetical protein
MASDPVLNYPFRSPSSSREIIEKKTVGSAKTLADFIISKTKRASQAYVEAQMKYFLVRRNAERLLKLIGGCLAEEFNPYHHRVPFAENSGGNLAFC